MSTDRQSLLDEAHDLLDPLTPLGCYDIVDAALLASVRYANETTSASDVVGYARELLFACAARLELLAPPSPRPKR